MVKLILNEDHLAGVLAEALGDCRHRLMIATANVKDVHVPAASLGQAGLRRRAVSIVEVCRWLGDREVQVQLLHSGVPSGAFLDELKRGVPENLTMRRCGRMHAKAIIVDGRWMYVGSANLTGAGLGAKSPRRRNFEAGIWTDELPLIDPVADMLQAIFAGENCGDCGRRDHCPEPLEEPHL